MTPFSLKIFVAEGDPDGLRVMYVAKLEDAVYVLHCFQKKTQRTSKADIALAQDRYKALIRSKK